MNKSLTVQTSLALYELPAQGSGEFAHWQNIGPPRRLSAVLLKIIKFLVTVKEVSPCFIWVLDP